MRCRLDARLRHCYFICILSRSHSDTRLALVLHWDFGRTTARLPFYFPCMAISLSECALLIYSYASCLHLLYLMSELSCEYFHSTHLACWFGQMLTMAILWMKSSIASPTPRGVPVSPVRSWNWSLVLYTLPPPTISILEPHSDARRAVVFRSHITRFAVILPPPLLSWVSSCHPTRRFVLAARM